MELGGAFLVTLGDRGRFVLPARVRKQLELRGGDELLLSIQPDGSLRLTPAHQVVRETRGLYRSRQRRRSLVRELIADRRAEARASEPVTG